MLFYFLWQRWPELKERIVKPDGLGLVVIIWGVFQLLVAWLGSEYFTMRSSLIVLLAGMTQFWFGREVLRMALPLGYLIFMVLALQIGSGKIIPTAGQLTRLDVAPVVNGISVPNGVVDTGDSIVLLSKIVGKLAM